MIDLKPHAPPAAQYEQDLVLWMESQIALLRTRQFDALDLDNVIEELDGTVRSLHRELNSRLEVLLMHLLKCQFQHHRISSNWLGTLAEQRSQIEKLLEESPSLAGGVMAVADKAYPMAARRAAIETRLPLSTFPAANPYTQEQLFDLDFVP